MISWTIRHVAETGSTNADLLGVVDDPRHPDAGVDHLVLRTDHQTAGRGRLDRRWDAPPGSNLLVSILFRHPPDRPQVLTQAVALAALRAVDRVLLTVGRRADVVASIKWPNDLLLGEQKLAGVLAQRHPGGAVVVGLGMNVGWSPDEAASIASVAEASILSPALMLDEVLGELSALADDAGAFDLGAIADGVRARMSTIESRVRIELPGGRSAVGRAVDIDDDGRLVVDVEQGDVEQGDDGGRGDGEGDGRSAFGRLDRRRFDVGDVVHLRAM